MSGILFGNVYGADISIVKTYTLGLSNAVKFILTVKNAGPGVAASVIVSDAVPANWKFYAVTTSKGTCNYNSTSKKITCHLGSLNPNTTALVKLTVIPLKSTTRFQNCALVSTTTFDLNTGNNQSCVSRP